MIMIAFSLPKSTDEEKKLRKDAIESATRNATEVPFKTTELDFASMEIIKAMAENGNPNSVSDAGVGALCARSAVMGAFLNVKINASGLKDKAFVTEVLNKGFGIEQIAMTMETEILQIVNDKIKF